MNVSKYSKLFIQIVRETSVRETSVPESDYPGNVCPGIVLSGKGLVRETSCPGNVCPGKWLSGKRPLPLPTTADTGYIGRSNAVCRWVKGECSLRPWHRQTLQIIIYKIRLLWAILRLFVPQGRLIAPIGWNQFSHAKVYPHHGLWRAHFYFSNDLYFASKVTK